MEQFPTIPLRNLFIVPGLATSIIVGRKESVNAVKSSKENFASKIVLIPQVDSNDETVSSSAQFQTVGTVCQILDFVELPDKSIKVQVQGLNAADVFKIELIESCWYSSYNERLYPVYNEQEATVISEMVFESFTKYSKINSLINPTVIENIRNSTTKQISLYKIIAYVRLSLDELFSIFRMSSYEEIAKSILEYIEVELQQLEMKRSIELAIRKKIEGAQKKIFLHEQLKEINNQLNDGNTDKDNYLKKLENIKDIDSKSREKIKKEIVRLDTIHNSSPEFSVLSTYIDTVLALPWDIEEKMDIDISKVSTKLDENHYGLDDVKDKILQQLAVMQYSGKMIGSIICLVGPPGVGKSTLAKSVADAIGRKFINFSLGGLSDEAELKGHRKTYIGAMPGQIIKKISDSGVSNPVFLLDEVDKLGNGVKGDPSHTLLEILDREQNHTFQDNYIDIPFDLSKVMFILTANNLNTISRPLLDRVEVISISSYLYPEKIEIALNHIVKDVIKSLSSDSLFPITFKKSAIDSLIQLYTRESGVRQLKRDVETIVKKAIKSYLVSKDTKRIYITSKNIEDYLGKPKYRTSDILNKNGIGNVVGLAWTAVGGSILFVQATIFKSTTGKYLVTGNMGNVMKESCSIALSVAKKYCENSVDADFYKNHEIHLHIPDGAVPKDGPSAGITITVAIVSAILSKKVEKTIAMTGELSLVGNVLPIGGLREKLTAAIASGTKTVLVPKENSRDVDELPSYIKDHLEIILVSRIEEVLDLSFK